MIDWPILSLVTFLPLAGALLILVMRGQSAAIDRHAKHIALWTTLATFAVSLLIPLNFAYGTSDFQFTEKLPWLGGAINYHMGVDGISMPFVILTTFLMPLCILASWVSVEKRVKEYMVA